MLDKRSSESSERIEKDEKTKFHRIERSYGRYVRTFRVPDDVDGEKIAADGQGAYGCNGNGAIEPSHIGSEACLG